MPLAYSSNPTSYQHLLAAGISPAQIRSAINNGLNPYTLPPEYFGLSHGWNPQSVGPGATPTPAPGGVGFPPATGFNPGASWDQYSFPTPNPQPNVGGTDISNFGSNAVPYFQPPVAAGSYGMGPTVETPTSSSFPFQPYTPYTDFSDAWTGYDQIGQSYGGSDISSFGGDMSLGPGLPSSTTDYLGIPGSYDQQPSVEVNAGDVPPWSEPGPLFDPTGVGMVSPTLGGTGDVPPPEGWVDGMPPFVQPGAIPDVADQNFGVTPDGTATPDQGTYGGPPTGLGWPAPDSLPIGMMPGQEMGVFAPAGPFSTPGVGPQFTYNNPDSSVYGGDLNPHAGMFGLGAMDAASSGWNLTGAGYGDQFSRVSSGWDQGWGDPAAFGDWLSSKHGGIGPASKPAKGK